METKGPIINGSASEFQHAVFLNDPSIAYKILDSVLDPVWYPENAVDEWTDIAVLDGKYYAVFAQDSVMAQEAAAVYIEIVPSPSMVKQFEYFNSVR